ncbi:MAG TPA: hypothetical protein VLM75_11510 [Spirochaetota bacterium]|nr:hypothetical protein [Spirochaetota bacterium]
MKKQNVGVRSCGPLFDDGSEEIFPGEGEGGSAVEADGGRGDDAGGVPRLDDFRRESWKERESYRAAPGCILGELASMSSDLQAACFMLAVRGPWRDWDKTVPAGTTINIDDEMLKDSGDKTISALMGLKERIDELLEGFDE